MLADCWAGTTLADGTAHSTAGPAGIEQGPLGQVRVHSPGSAPAAEPQGSVLFVPLAFTGEAEIALPFATT